MNRYGAAGDGAFNPQTVVAYLDSLVSWGVRNGRDAKLLNGQHIRTDDARIIRRWRNQAKGVSYKGVKRLFDTYGLDLSSFKRWAKRRKLPLTN